jgi:hypothetical protein
MYTIVVKKDHSLSSPRKERIMQRSKLVDTLWFLVEPYYDDLDIASCTVMLEYVLPVSRKYCTEFLTLSDEMYKDHLKYVLPFDTNLTSEAGEIELQLTFAYVGLNEYGKGVQRTRKTSSTSIYITPITAWSDIIPDSALTALDQRIIKQDAQFKALVELSESIANNKADNIEYDYENNELQLLSGDKKIGDRIMLRNADEELEDGVPVVDFNSSSSDDNSDNNDDDTNNNNNCNCNCNCNCDDDVVEFDNIDATEKLEDSDVVEF